ncbi:hypothetical protein L3Q82_012948, partial [Scortum barcoo]
MILNNRNEELNCRFHVRVDDFDYVLFATSAVMKCFGCGEEGHVIKACPKRGELAPPGPGPGRLDVCGSTVPGLMGALCRTGAVCLKQLVDAAGPALTDAEAVSSVLWRQRLSEKETTILNRYGKGEVEPDHTDTFPEVHLSPDLKDLNGPLLT